MYIPTDHIWSVQVLKYASFVVYKYFKARNVHDGGGMMKCIFNVNLPKTVCVVYSVFVF